MSAQITTIYPANVALPTTIIDALDGSSSMYIENPWFLKPLGSTVYNKDIGKIKVRKDSTGKIKKAFGMQFGTPRLFMRPGTEGPFTNQFTIRYGNPDERLKSIKVKKPYFQDGKVDVTKYKVSLSISPNGINKDDGKGPVEDEIMLKIDQIYTTVLEFVMVAVAAKFDGFTAKDDNKSLITKLCAHIGVPGGESNMNDAFYTYFENPPTWEKSSGDGIFYIESTSPEKQHSIMNLMKVLIQRNERSVKMNNELKKVIKDKRCAIIPCFKRLRYETKKIDESTGEPVMATIIEGALKFHLQIPGSTPVNFPTRFFTKTPKRDQRNHVMDSNELQEFYGVYNNDYNKAKWYSHYDAAIFMGIATEYAIYPQGQPKIQWYAETVFYKRKEALTATQSAFEDALFDAVEDDDEIIPAKRNNPNDQRAQEQELMEMDDDE
jgi:hypothetical protein